MARRYLTLGTGAIGGTLGGALAHAGVPTVWIARGAHADALGRDGLTLHTPAGTLNPRATVWRSPADAALTPDDVILLCTKLGAVAEAAAAWSDAPVAGGGTAGERLPIVAVTNGVRAERELPRFFARVFGAEIWCPSTFLTPGEVAVRFGPRLANLHVGRVPADLTTDADRALLADLAADFARANLAATPVADVMPWKYRKLVNNMINTVDALLGPGHEAARDRVTARLVDEATAVLNAAGISLITPDADRAARAGDRSMAPVAGFDAAAMGASSTWQSLAKGEPLETDDLNGEIVAIAHSHGLRAPLNAALCRVARQAQRERWRPGALMPDALDSVLDAGS